MVSWFHGFMVSWFAGGWVTGFAHHDLFPNLVTLAIFVCISNKWQGGGGRGRLIRKLY